MSNYKRVSNTALRRFQQILIDAGYTTTIRTTRGEDIDAACGQLAGQVQDRTKRSQRYKMDAAALMAAGNDIIPVKLITE